ncbi:MAG: hypothetical protein IKA47_03100 [Oscillospiraceae bacterium]|nr:hypothetical protein [Oscillospiraceae bacterium]
MKNTFSAGYAAVNITPPFGIPLAGYFVERPMDGVLDDLQIRALALSDGEAKAVILVADLLGIRKVDLDPVRQTISQKLGIPVEAVFIACTHTHTAPQISENTTGKLPEKWHFYQEMLWTKFADAADLAFQDLAPARMGWAVGNAPHIAFIRRYRMKDGSVRTNPGVGNPEILAPIGTVDERVNLLRFVREKGDIALVNFGVHPDTVGGCKVSADYPAFVCRALEAVTGCKALFLNGAQGDVNHVNVAPVGGDNNGLSPQFDDCDRGYGHTRHMGRTIAGGVLQVYEKVRFVEAPKLSFGSENCRIPANKAEEKDLPLAREYAALHNAGKDSEIPYTGMQLTTVVAEAMRMLRLENGPDHFDLPVSALAIGPAVLVGIPGEPFTGIGRGIKEGAPFDITLPCCCANGYEGYFPMQDAYDEGGYEARSSNFAAGVAEKLIATGVELTKKVR